MATSLKQVIEEAYIDGRYCYSTFRRVYPFSSVAGYWVDLSMAPGNPVPNYYLGEILTATVPVDWYKKGLWHGGAVSPYQKRLHKICMLSTGAGAAPAPFLLCDYLMYYPLIDMDNTEEQEMINYGPEETPTTSPLAATLPRYINEPGVMACLIATNPYVGGQAFSIKYTNERGDSDRVSKRMITNTSTNIGTIVNSGTAAAQQYGAFIQLAAGDNGISKVQSITFEASNGGLAVLVLMRPLATLFCKEATAWAEYDFIRDKPSLPRIYDGAYLNLMTMPSATLSAVPIIGEITTIWGS